MRRARRILTWLGLGTILSVILLGSPANADFHEQQIDELMAGLNGDANIQFIEIKMFNFGQNCQGTGNKGVGQFNCDTIGPGARLVFFNATGVQTAEFIFPGNTPIDLAAHSILIATQQFADLPGSPQPDFIMPANVVPDSGRFCYQSRLGAPFFIDLCLSYGGSSGVPALPITGNSSLKRVNNTFNNSLDFALGTPEPRSNCGATSSSNRCPVADAQSFTIAEDTPVNITLTGSDPEGASLTFSIPSFPDGPFNGTLSGTPPNITYTPRSNFSGSDSFTFRVNDGVLDGAATVFVTVTQVNDPPVANPQSVATPHDTPVSIFLSGFDPEGSSLTFSIVTGPANGALSGTPPNVTYTPNTGFAGADSFTFRANDGALDGSPAAVSITVRPPCSVTPIAFGETKTGTLSITDCAAPHRSSSFADLYTFSGTAGQKVIINMTTTSSFFPGIFLQNPSGTVIASSFSCSGLSFTSACIPFNGASGGGFTLPSDGSYTIEATSLFSSVTGTYTVSLAICCPPVANAQTVMVTEDTPANINLTGSDPDGAPLTFSIVIGPTNGSFSGTLPNVTYTPSPNYNGAESFTFKVNDGILDSTPATVSITVVAVNDPPVADAGPNQAVTEGALVTLDGTASSDPDGDTLTFSWSKTAGPSVTLTGGNTGSPKFNAPFIPPPGVTLSFQLTVTDPGGLSASDSIDVQVISMLLDHFKCYTAAVAKAAKGQPPIPTFTPHQVTLEDQFETKLTNVLRPLAVCAPADKNDEGVIDSNTHLEAYQIADNKTPVQPRFVPQRNTVSNQLGTLVINSTKVDRLLVPTSKALGVVPPSPPDPENVDHYKCYTITVAKAPKGQPPFPTFTPITVTVEDQFGTRVVTLTRPIRLCNPVEKNNEEIKNPDNHLMCYSAVIAKTVPPQPLFPKTRVALANQFGTEVLDLTVQADVCVPSVKGPAP
jgi:hypothetical protein